MRNYKKLAYRFITALTASTLAFLPGCSDNGAKHKEEAMEAFQKQKEITQYSFSGKAELQLEGWTPKEANPLLLGLYSLLKNSTVTWSGTESRQEPVRMEGKITVEPKDSEKAFTIPVMIHEGKLYASFPLVNQPEEYIVTDLKQAGVNFGFSTDPLTEKLISILPEEWFDKQKDGTYSATVKQKQTEDFLQAFSNKLPDWIGVMQDRGLLTKEQSDAYRTEAEAWDVSDWAKRTTVSKDSGMTLEQNDKGFITGQHLLFDFLTTGKDGTKTPTVIRLDYTIDRINETPAFTMEIPKQTIPLNEIIERIK